MKAVNKTLSSRNLADDFILLSLLMFLNGDFGEFFDKEFFIKLIGVDDVFQRTKARKTTAYAGGMTVNKKPGSFGRGLQHAFHACFTNFKNIAHGEHRISFFPRVVFALAQTRFAKPSPNCGDSYCLA
jgi:hypothetical protein